MEALKCRLLTHFVSVVLESGPEPGEYSTTELYSQLILRFCCRFWFLVHLFIETGFIYVALSVLDLPL